MRRLEKVRKINNQYAKLAMNFPICLKCDICCHLPVIKAWRMTICKLSYKKIPVRTMRRSDEENQVNDQKTSLFF